MSYSTQTPEPERAFTNCSPTPTVPVVNSIRFARLYTGYGSQIRRISAEPIVETPERATDYTFKALKRGRVTMQNIWIFPRCLSELPSKRGNFFRKIGKSRGR